MKPKYRYNWKTGKVDELVRLELRTVSENEHRAALTKMALRSSISGDDYRQAQRKRNMEVSNFAAQMALFGTWVH